MHLSNVVLSWRNTLQGNWLIGAFCKQCEKTAFPYTATCKKCGEATEKRRLKGSGKIFSFTKIYSAPTLFEKQVPYFIVLVKLEEGPKITAQLVDTDTATLDMPVQACVRKIAMDGDTGLIRYGIKFKPRL